MIQHGLGGTSGGTRFAGWSVTNGSHYSWSWYTSAIGRSCTFGIHAVSIFGLRRRSAATVDTVTVLSHICRFAVIAVSVAVAAAIVTITVAISITVATVSVTTLLGCIAVFLLVYLL